MAESAGAEARDDAESRRAWWRRPAVVVSSVVAVIVIVVLAFLLTPRSDSGTPGAPGATPTPTSSGSQTGAPEPSAEPSGSSSPAPTPTTAETPPSEPAFPELPPVDPTELGEADEEFDGLSFRIIKVEHVTGEVVGPGDVSAPAVRITVRATNRTGEPFDLRFVAVNAYTSPDRTPADFYEQPGSKPFAGTLADGDSVRGVYVIRVPEDKRDDLTVVIDYAAGVPAVVFEGDFSDTRG